MAELRDQSKNPEAKSPYYKPWPKETVLEAQKLYEGGERPIDIAYVLGVPDGTIRRWASTKQWGKKNNIRPRMLKNPGLQRLQGIIARMDKNLKTISETIEGTLLND